MFPRYILPVLYLVFVFVCNTVLLFLHFFIVSIFELYKLYICIQLNREKKRLLKCTAIFLFNLTLIYFSSSHCDYVKYIYRKMFIKLLLTE